MSVLLAIITIITLLFTGISIWKSYYEKALLHPGLYFCIIWLLAIFSYLYINTFYNKYNVINPEHVDELHVYILFTSISFFILKNIKKHKVVKNFSTWNVYDFESLYKHFSSLAFVSAIILFIIRGATFDFAANRNSMVELETLLFTGYAVQGLLNTLLGAFTSANLILAIFAGFLICEIWRGKSINIISRVYLLIPFFTQIILMISVGGRNDLIWILRCYIFGSAISLANGMSRAKLKKIIIIFTFFLSLFMLYSNFNLEKRKSNIDDIVDWDEQLAKPFSSVIEYFSSVYVGYQLRRDDFVTDELEYGEKSFAGILFFNLPFSGVFRIEGGSIGEALGFEKYTMKKMFLELQSQNAAWFSTVSSIYLLFYDDFGYYGTFAVIFIMVYLTQLFFVKWFVGYNNSFFSLYFHLLFFILWTNSIFDPVFATGNVRTLLYSIAMIQLALYIRRAYRKKKFGFTHQKRAGVT